MKGFYWRLAGLCTLVAVSPLPLQALEVGAASAPVSPGVDTFLAGYDRDRRSEGVADEVFAQAVVIADEQLALAIVVIDCIGLLHDDVLAIRRRVMAGLAQRGSEVPLAAERILVTSTHTHAGPDVAGLWGRHLFSSGRDEAYIERLVSVAAEQVLNAAERLVPARARATSVRAVLSWVENVSEPGLLDDRLSVMQFLRAAGPEAGASIATLTNFACHPTVLGPDNHLVSADYVAGFYRDMQASLGGVNLFLQGSIGGWVQPVQGDRSFRLAADYGETVAVIARRALAEALFRPSSELAFRSRRCAFPWRTSGSDSCCGSGSSIANWKTGHFRTEAAWFSIGNAQFVTHPGETSPAYSLASRELMNDAQHTFVLGLGLDALGYILKPEYFEDTESIPNADYLTSVSVGPQTGPLLMQALETLILRSAPASSASTGRHRADRRYCARYTVRPPIRVRSTLAYPDLLRGNRCQIPIQPHQIREQPGAQHAAVVLVEGRLGR